jgi:hypothetical protein
MAQIFHWNTAIVQGWKGAPITDQKQWLIIVSNHCFLAIITPIIPMEYRPWPPGMAWGHSIGILSLSPDPAWPYCITLIWCVPIIPLILPLVIHARQAVAPNRYSIGIIAPHQAMRPPSITP